MAKRQFGSYVMFTVEPEGVEGKKEYVKAAFSKLMDQICGADMEPDWGTLQIIVREGNDFWGGDDENDPYIGWMMTVAVKIQGEEYSQEDEDGKEL